MDTPSKRVGVSTVSRSCLPDASGARVGVRVNDSGQTVVAGSLSRDPGEQAGAYAIQGGAGVFVDALDGSFSNVMGFPTKAVREMLSHFGL